MAQPSNASPVRMPRIPRAEALLGVALEDLTPALMADIVQRQVREDQSLDWKGQLFEPKNWWKLAKVAASFANAGGGVVIFGIDEDEQARARVLTPVPLSDENRRKIVDALIRLVAPVIPGYYLHEIAAEGDDSAGFYCVVVPASPAAPHAVVMGEQLFYPIREDAQCRNMREPEVAARYRDRFATLTGRTERLRLAHAEGLQRLPEGPVEVWLTVAVAPEQPGHLAVNVQLVRDSREWLRGWLSDRTPRQSFAVDAAATVGRQRVIHSSQYEYAGTSDDWHLELHADGTFYGAVRLAAQPECPERAPEPLLPVNALELESQLLTLLSIAAGHADRAGAGGDLLVRCQISPARNPTPIWTFTGTGRSFSIGGIKPTVCARNMLGDNHKIAGTFPVGNPHPVEQSTTRSVATDAVDLVVAGHQLASEMLAEFGLQEPHMLRADGSLHLSELHGDLPPQINGWANAIGVTTDLA